MNNQEATEDICTSKVIFNSTKHDYLTIMINYLQLVGTARSVAY